MSDPHGSVGAEGPAVLGSAGLPPGLPAASPAAAETVQASRSLLFALLAILVCAAATGVFFRDFIASRFNLVAGNIGDSRFNTAVLEHWRAVAHGRAWFTSPNYFWPAPGVLGYSDALFLLAVPYVLLRSLGLDYYLSYEIVLITLKIVGFFSMLWLLRVVGTSRAVALLGAVLFTLSNLYYISVGHCQLIAVAFTPLCCALAVKHWQEETSGRIAAARAWVCAAGGLLGLLLFTSFYIGWFTLLAGGVVLLGALAGRIVQARSLGPARQWARLVAARWRTLLVGIAAFGFSIVPFLMTYLPVLKLSGGRPFEEILRFSAQPIDAINVTTSNWLWGKLLAPALAPLDARYAAGEMQRGWPALILLVFAGATMAGAWRLLRPAAAGCESKRLLLPTLGASAVLLWGVSVKWGGFFPWWIVFKLIPGAAAIRVPVRIHFVLNVLVIIVVIMAIEQWAERLRGGKKACCLLLCGACLVAEEINVAPCHQIRRDAENAILSRVPPPPADCRAFMVTTPATADRPFYANQIDAMFIGRRLNLPTINGYSGGTPPGWDFMMFDGDYARRARRWAVAQGVTGLCGCDLRNDAWSHIDPGAKPAYTLGSLLDFHQGGNAAEFQGEGWADAEPGGTWTLGPRSLLLLPLDPLPKTDLLLNLETHAFTPSQRPQFTETVSVNGAQLASWQITGRELVIRKQVRIPRALLSSPIRVEFFNHDARSPFEMGYSEDHRKVGLAVHSISLDSPFYVLGSVIDFRQGGNARRFEAEGWADAEPGGSWTLGPRSALLLPVDPLPQTDLVLSLEMHAFTPSQRSRFTETVSVNGSQLASWLITDRETVIQKQIRVPRALLSSPRIRVEFYNHDARSPFELGYSVDRRKVGLALHSIRLEPAGR